MAAGPWTNVSTPAPGRSVVYHSAGLGLTAPVWKYESPSGAYAPRGAQYLYVVATVANAGLSNVTLAPAAFEAVWNQTGVVQAGEANWAPALLRPGNNASVLVAFWSSTAAPPDAVRLTVDAGAPAYAWKQVPPATAPQPAVQFAAVNATWSTYDIGGLNTSNMSRFLWLTFELVNLWDSTVPLTAASFEVEGTGSTTYGAPQFRGPTSVGAGGRANITLVFEVPATWEPWWLHFDAPGGPWADAALPLPA
jgi:hypothetical protein